MSRKNNELVTEVIRDYENRKAARKTLESNWLLNINFVIGNQFAEILPNGDITDLGKRYYWQEREVYNHIAPIVESRLSRFSNTKVDVTVRPSTSDKQDIETAKFSTKLLKSIEEENNLKKLINEATFWSELTGTCFYKVAWSPNKGRLVDAEEILYEGDIEISVCPPYEIYPDSLASSDVDYCQSIIHAKAYPVESIEDIWGVKLDGEDVSVLNMDATQSGGGFGYTARKTRMFCDTKSNHAVVIERYSMPSIRYPNGRLTIVAKDKLLYNGDLPFINKADGKRGYPFIKQFCLMQPSSFYGSTVIERLIPIQRAYNALKNRKHEYFNRMAMGVLMVEDGSVDIDSIEEEGIAPGKVIVYRQGSTVPIMMNMGGVPSDFRDEEDRLLSEFVTVSGVSDFLTSSVVQADNLSGVALNLIIEQDNNRLSLTTDSVRFAIKEVGQHILRLYRQFADTKRLKRITGENGEIEMLSFASSDISSDDLVFDLENEFVNSMANRKSLATELYKMGIFNDESGNMSKNSKLKLLEIFGFGNWESASSSEDLHRKRADKENLKIKETAPEIQQEDIHSIHIIEHSDFLIGQEDMDEKTKTKLNDHIKEHRTYLRLTNQANNL